MADKDWAAEVDEREQQISGKVDQLEISKTAIGEKQAKAEKENNYSKGTTVTVPHKEALTLKLQIYPSQPDGHASVGRKTSGQFSILETQENYELERYKQLYEETKHELNGRNELLNEKTQELEQYKGLLVQLTQDLQNIQRHKGGLETQIQQMERNKKVFVERIQELERENKVLTEKTQEMENKEQFSKERMQELAKQKQLLQTMGETLQCSICFDVVRQALSLHCGHSFCSQCIERWTCENRRAQNGPFCPTCRSPDCSTMRILMLCGVANDFRAFNNATRDEVEEEHNNELFAARLSSSNEEDDVFHDAFEELPGEYIE